MWNFRKSYAFFLLLFFTVACQRIFIKTHSTESRRVTALENIPFLGTFLFVCIFLSFYSLPSFPAHTNRQTSASDNYQRLCGWHEGKPASYSTMRDGRLTLIHPVQAVHHVKKSNIYSPHISSRAQTQVFYSSTNKTWVSPTVTQATSLTSLKPVRGNCRQYGTLCQDFNIRWVQYLRPPDIKVLAQSAYLYFQI